MRSRKGFFRVDKKIQLFLRYLYNIREEQCVTKERLQKLSLPSLLRIASNEGIKEAKELPREELVELILEAMAEERYERERSNNTAIRIEEKKYDIFRDEELRRRRKGPTVYPINIRRRRSICCSGTPFGPLPTGK